MLTLKRDIGAELRDNKVVNVPSDAFILAGCFSDMVSFTKTWETMGIDEYYGQPKKGRRFRRYSDFLYDPEADTLNQLEHRPYEQSENHNKYVGGIIRDFDDVTSDVSHSRILKSLVRLDFEVYKQVLPKEYHTKVWQCQIHQIRIEVYPDQELEITPEGIHCDGYPFSGVHFWGKENIVGAESRVYTKQEDVIGSGTYEEILDTTFFLDRELLHYVTPAKNTSNDSNAFRQIIAISFSIPGSDYDIIK